MRTVIALVLAIAFVIFAAVESRWAERSALSAVSTARPRPDSWVGRRGLPGERPAPRLVGP